MYDPDWLLADYHYTPFPQSHLCSGRLTSSQECLILYDIHYLQLPLTSLQRWTLGTLRGRQIFSCPSKTSSFTQGSLKWLSKLFWTQVIRSWIAKWCFAKFITIVPCLDLPYTVVLSKQPASQLSSPTSLTLPTLRHGAADTSIWRDFKLSTL